MLSTLPAAEEGCVNPESGEEVQRLRIESMELYVSIGRRESTR